MRSDWLNTTIGKIAKINPESLGSDTPLDFRFGYIDLSMVSGGIVTYPQEQIFFSSSSPRARRIVQNGDILMSTVRPNLRGFGRLNYPSDEPLVCSTGFAVLRCNDESTARYVYQFLFSEFFDRQIYSLVVGSNYPAINSEEVSGLCIAIPRSPHERETIAVTLETWDTMTQSLIQLIDLLQKKYVGLRSRLINWTSGPQEPVRSFLKPVSRPTEKPNEPYRALSIRSHGKGSYVRLVEDPQSVEMETLYVARAGDLIVNITFGWEGALALVPPEHDGCLVSHRFPTFCPLPSKTNARYLRHALRMPRFTYLLGVVSPGGAGRNRVLSKSEFLDLKVPFPSLDEQARIAEILDEAEQAVTKEHKRLDAIVRQKRGLMQKLLTGEWRVQADARDLRTSEVAANG